jgi:hypothetical protein
MATRKSKPSGLTIFSIDPSTGLPPIPINEVTKVILWQIQRQHSSMLKRFETDDLTQDVLTRLALVTYSKEKSAPVTFITMVTDSVIWSKHGHSQSNNRFLEIPDFIVGEPGSGESTLCTELGTDLTSPEDHLLAMEIIVKSLIPKCKRSRKCRVGCKCEIKLPPGYQHQRALRKNTQK